MPFSAIKGQERPLGIIKTYMEKSHLQGGYLFAGPEGVGKKMFAWNLAKAVNCLQNNLDSCDECPSCRRIENNQHPDVHLIEGLDAEIKIEDIRQLQKEISLKPYEAEFKIFIIDNAHRLTAEAGNAILKILEEPPLNSLIILITDKPGLIFKTIISRCKVLKFYPLPRPRLEQILKNDYAIENNLAHFLAYFCEGRIGYALRLKGTDILTQKNRVIDKFILTPRLNLEDLPIQKRDEVRSYLNILACWFRDIYLAKIGMAHSEIVNFDRWPDLSRQMVRLSFQQLDGIFHSISDAIFRLEQNINVKLLLYALKEEL